MVNTPLLGAERLQLSFTVVDDPNRRAEAQLHRSFSDDQCVLRIVHAAAHYRIDIHVELGMFRQELQLLIKHLEALLRNLVRCDVIDRDLQPLQSRSV